MATHDIFMPALSSTMTEGKIVEWLKQPGDKVGRGESVLVVESDKADMDVESFQEGCLLYTSPSPRDVEESRMPSSA